MNCAYSDCMAPRRWWHRRMLQPCRGMRQAIRLTASPIELAPWPKKRPQSIRVINDHKTGWRYVVNAASGNRILRLEQIRDAS